MQFCIPHSKYILAIIRLLFLAGTTTLPAMSIAQPGLTSPAANSTLAGTTHLFNWSVSDINVERWWLYVGSSPGAKDISNSGDLGTSTQYNVIGIPVDGTTVHSRLWYFSSSQWRYIDNEFKAAQLDNVQTPAMINPAADELLVNGHADFR